MDLKIKDVAELLKVSETTIAEWVEQGKIPGYHLGKQYRFNRHEIENWMLRTHLPPIFAADSLPKTGKQHFILYRSLHQGKVLSELAATTKEELIRKTTAQIAPELNVDADVLAELLLDREALMSTSLGQGIAVPHIRDFLGKGVMDRIFVVYAHPALEYGSLDKEPVHTLFFLFAGSDKNHLHLLAKVAHFVSSSENKNFLLQKPSKLKLLEKILSWEE